MSSIGIDIKIFIIQIINFFILFFVLKWLLYKPILKILSERKKKIEDALMLADKNRKEADELEIKNQEKIKIVKEEAKKILEETRNQIKEESKAMRTETEKEIERLKEKSISDIEFERSQMISSLKKELAELILLTSGKLTKESIKVEVQNKLVDEMIEELQKKDLNDLK